MNAAAPVLIGYDGSGAARRAVHEAAELFGSRRALVLTVWEQGMAYGVATMPWGDAATGTVARSLRPIWGRRGVR